MFTADQSNGAIMLTAFHVALAYLTVAGFVIRGVWALTDSPLREEKWVRISPHVIDTLLLVLGVALATRLDIRPFSGWLGAKLVGLLVYVGFGVMTMRASSHSLRLVGFVGALLAAVYIFTVAFSRSPWPL